MVKKHRQWQTVTEASSKIPSVPLPATEWMKAAHRQQHVKTAIIVIGSLSCVDDRSPDQEIWQGIWLSKESCFLKQDPALWHNIYSTFKNNVSKNALTLHLIKYIIIIIIYYVSLYKL